jgi:Spy/CpxP family protein refolding chaperone
MKSIVRRTILAVFLSTVIIAISVAQPPHGRGSGSRMEQGYPNQKCQNIENRIPDLTEDQKAELKSLKMSHLKEMKDFRNQMGEISAKQRTIMSGNPIDQKAVGILIDQKSELMNKQMKAQVTHKVAFKEILTEEQVLAFEKSQSRRHFSKTKGRSGHGKGGCFGPQNRQHQGRKF